MAGGAQAATFGFSFLYDGDSTPGGGTAATLSDLVEYGRGTVTVKDSAILPSGLATFASGDITAFNVKMTDNFGRALEWDLSDDGNNLDADQFGVRFDEAGNFERFDSPLFSKCSGCFFIFDDEYESPGRTTQGAGLMILDRDLRFGYLTEDVFRFGRTFSEGTIVLLRDFEGAPVQPFSNIFTAENSESENWASGYILSTGLVPEIQPVPLPAGLPLLVAGLAGLGWFGTRGRSKRKHDVLPPTA